MDKKGFGENSTGHGCRKQAKKISEVTIGCCNATAKNANLP
jgi:hypothetical protein